MMPKKDAVCDCGHEAKIMMKVMMMCVCLMNVIVKNFLVFK